MMELFGATLWGYLMKGGVVMWPILLLSIVSLFFILERALTYSRCSINVQRFMSRVSEYIQGQRIKDAIEFCETQRGPVPVVIRAGLMKFGSSRQEVERAMENFASYQVSRLERGLPVLASIANISPLLGFLGTVVGMIQSFDVISAYGLNNPAAVAKGISIALLTTAFGLIVAVFTLPFYNFYTTKVSSFVKDMEASANVLLETIDSVCRAEKTVANPNRKQAVEKR
jgi:biopolymer transport protein ExbB